MFRSGQARFWTNRAGFPDYADVPGDEKERLLKVEAIDHLVLNVSDVERSAQWYEQVLGMRRLKYEESAARPRMAMLFGGQRINLRPVDHDPTEWVTANHTVIGSNDLCFLTGSTPEAVQEHLKTCGVEIVEGPVSRGGARGFITSVYCRDPDGSLVEISSYDSSL